MKDINVQFVTRWYTNGQISYTLQYTETPFIGEWATDEGGYLSLTRVVRPTQEVRIKGITAHAEKFVGKTIWEGK